MDFSNMVDNCYSIVIDPKHFRSFSIAHAQTMIVILIMCSRDKFPAKSSKLMQEYIDYDGLERSESNYFSVWYSFKMHVSNK